MNGPIAQLVALTCYANSFLKGGLVAPAVFSPDNSTCKFCDRISFVEIKKSWLGKQIERATADSPDAWFRQLLAQGASAVRMLHQSRNDPGISDRMSAGFVGGGGQWMLAVSYPNETEYWMSRWEVWNQNAPEQRIWRVAYGLVARDKARPPSDPDFSVAKAEFASALERIRAFSVKHNCWGVHRVLRPCAGFLGHGFFGARLPQGLVRSRIAVQVS